MSNSDAINEGWVLLSSKQVPKNGEEVLWASLEDGGQCDHLGKLKDGRVHAVVYGNANEVSWSLRNFYQNFFSRNTPSIVERSDISNTWVEMDSEKSNALPLR